MSRPYSHVTITVVTGDETWTYDIPRVRDLTLDTKYAEDRNPWRYSPYELTAPNPVTHLAFGMRPLSNDDGIVMTIMKSDPS